MTTVQSITPEQLTERLAQPGSIHLIDVRTPAEFQEVHHAQAKNIPLDRLGSNSIPNDGKEVVFICKSGTRGRRACEQFVKDRTDVFNVEGGTDACVTRGLPVVRGQKVMSLERQVRVAAGSLVLLGVGLSFLHPAFIGLSAFVGAGLVFAGLTDTCGMAMLLARMPWNNNPGAKSCSV